MNADRATYMDSSALVKLVVHEEESVQLMRDVRRDRRRLVSSALAQAEVSRALLPLGPKAIHQGYEVLAGIDLIRINDRVLATAGELMPLELRTLDAIHLATALQLGRDLGRLITYDERMIAAAEKLGIRVSRPG